MLADRTEFETRIVPLIEIDGDTVSSSRIREQIENGEVAAAAGQLQIERAFVLAARRLE